MENITMAKGMAPMTMSHPRTRFERSQTARLLAPVSGPDWGMTLSALEYAPALGAGCALGHIPFVTDQIATTTVITTLTTPPFMDVDDLRCARPPV